MDDLQYWQTVGAQEEQEHENERINQATECCAVEFKDLPLLIRDYWKHTSPGVREMNGKSITYSRRPIPLDS